MLGIVVDCSSLLICTCYMSDEDLIICLTNIHIPSEKDDELASIPGITRRNILNAVKI